MRQLVISDLHLDPSFPGRYEAAISSIKHSRCDQFILAGDIFEAWVGDDGAASLDSEFLEFCGGHSADTVFLHGNRDFLISSNILNRHNIRLITPPLHKFEVVIIHGDELCTDDHSYQQFRSEVRSPQWVREFLRKPLKERLEIAAELRQVSREAQANRPETICDAAQKTIDFWMANNNSNLLIHGHTHRPAVHIETRGIRVVTSDWEESGVGVVLETIAGIQKLQLSLLSPDGIGILEEWQRGDGMPEWKRNS